MDDNAQNESDDELNARSVAGLFRAARKIDERLAVFGQYDFLRDVFAGVEQRHVVEGGLSYLAVNVQPHRLRLDATAEFLRNPKNAFDLAREMSPHVEGPDNIGFALGETLAHVNRLVRQGIVADVSPHHASAVYRTLS